MAFAADVYPVGPSRIWASIDWRTASNLRSAGNSYSFPETCFHSLSTSANLFDSVLRRATVRAADQISHPVLYSARKSLHSFVTAATCLVHSSSSDSSRRRVEIIAFLYA